MLEKGRGLEVFFLEGKEGFEEKKVKEKLLA